MLAARNGKHRVASQSQDEESNESTVDGGRTALTGFLYQMVGTLGMGARVALTDLTDDGGSTDAFFYRLCGADFLHEAHDTDAIGVDGRNAATFIQFKYSRQPARSPIGPSEFSAIVRKLAKSANAAPEYDRGAIGFALVTNRHLGPEAEQAFARSRPRGKLRTPANFDRDSVLRRLQLVERMDMPYCRDVLRRFAVRYGAFDAEIRTGVGNLLQSMLEECAAGHPFLITAESLVAQFTGSESAEPLDQDHVRPKSMQRTRLFHDQYIAANHRPVIPRDKTDEIVEKAARASIVVVTGGGGCGKTTALWQWARQEAVNGESGAFTDIDTADEISDGWIAKIVCRWSNLSSIPQRLLETHDQSFERLRRANPGLRPLLHIGIDAVDEILRIPSATRFDWVRDLMRWFLPDKLPSASTQIIPSRTLVISARRLDSVRRFLGTIRSQRPTLGIEYVTFDDFDDAELLRMCAVALPEREFERVLQSISAAREGDAYRVQAPDTIPVGVGFGTSPVRSVHEDIIASLRQPAIWEALTATIEGGSITRFLDGDEQLLDEVAHALLERYIDKVIFRANDATHPDSDLYRRQIYRCLCEVAVHASRNDRTVFGEYADWTVPAIAHGSLSNEGAEALYAEAVSGGLVRVDEADRWYWRHPFVAEALAARGRARSVQHAG